MNAKKLKTLRTICRRVAKREGLPHRAHIQPRGPSYRLVPGPVGMDGNPTQRIVAITGTVENSERSFRGLYRYAKVEARA